MSLQVCYKLFELGRASETHFQRCVASLPYRCSNCGRGHTKLAALETHVTQCRAAAKFLCTQCFRCVGGAGVRGGQGRGGW